MNLNIKPMLNIYKCSISVCLVVVHVYVNVVCEYKIVSVCDMYLSSLYKDIRKVFCK